MRRTQYIRIKSSTFAPAFRRNRWREVTSCPSMLRWNDTTNLIVIKICGHGDKKRFTVRKMSGTVGVERIFPIESPNIDSIEINKIGKVRRAKLYYLRKLTGKAARIKEKRRPVVAE